MPIVNSDQTIALYQPMLQRIAYQLVRRKEDAEDIVQETFLKWLAAERNKIENTKAYLVTAVRNNCLTHLQSLKKKKEEYLEAIQKSDFVLWFRESNFAHLDLDVDMEKAIKVIHAKLEPLERAVFILKEVFDVDYDALQKIFDKKKDHCRQLVCRARKKLNEEASRIQFNLADVQTLLGGFRKSCEKGNLLDVLQVLKNDLRSVNSKKS